MPGVCEEEGIIFIGPRSETITQMGDKVIAKSLAKECGLPLVPGTEEATDDVEAAEAFAQEFGMPIMLKAAMGGGGRGMRIVRTMGELKDAFTRASSEALAAFGDGRMFLERYVEAPRHIEVQILADGHGNVVHLHERDCSVQRRHQKVVELAPAPILDPALRQTLHDDAVRLAKHVNYRNAGTVEFMVDKEGRHYFLEVNPRIQVEHTVTEEVTGIDLVQSQILIAGGATLDDIGIKSQDDIKVQGFAMQCRITTEDPQMSFAPDFGKVEVYRPRRHGRPPRRRGGRRQPRVPKLRLPPRQAHVQGEELHVRHPEDVPRARRVSRARGQDQHPVPPQRPPIRDVPLRRIRHRLYRLDAVAVRPGVHPGRHDQAPELPRGRRGQRREPSGGGGPRARRRRARPSEARERDAAPGFKQIIDEQGPAAFAKAVRDHEGLLLMDTTWRDAHQSALATRMRTRDLLASGARNG